MRTLPGILLLVATLAGCADTKKASPQPPASGTSVMAIVSSGSSYKIYLPAHESPTVTHAVVTVVNAAAPHGSSGLIRHVDLGVTGTARAVGAAGEDVVVSGESIPSVFFIDAASDTVRGSAPLPASSQLIVASGGLSYTAGVAVDQAQRKAYVSTSTGFAAYDVDTRLPAGQFAAPTPENFTLDPASQRLYAPFYLCDQSFPDGADICTAYQQPGGPALTDSLTVVDLASGDAFSLVDPAAAEPWAPLGLEVDAAALDPGLGVLALAVEFPPTLQVLDLAAATFDATALTCRMPGLTIALPDDLLTSVAVDPVTHILIAA